MVGSLPTVFVSSTFYDLQQVREDICIFVKDHLGYNFLASEHSSFPINPNLNTIDNCRQRVERDADLFVLVVGGRYGSIDKRSDKSVTNLEYVTARQKRIPVYAFIKNDILAQLPVWRLNNNANYEGIVDAPDLFRFVDELVSSERNVWTWPFATARDIVGTLRTQFGYLMRNGLDLQLRLRDLGDIPPHLSSAALKLVVDPPRAWEGRLFAQVLRDEIEEHRDLQRAYELDLAVGRGELVDETQSYRWLQARLTEAKRLAEGLTKLANSAFTSLDLPTLTWRAREIGRCHGHIFEWATFIRRAHLPPDFAALQREIARSSEAIASQIEDIPRSLDQAIESAIANDAGNGKLEIVVKIALTVPNSTQINEEIARIAGQRGIQLDAE